MTLPAIGPKTILGREMLFEALLDTVSLLRQRRAGAIAEDKIDGYVALNWLEWNGGTLRLTETGQNVHRQLTSRQT